MMLESRVCFSASDLKQDSGMTRKRYLLDSICKSILRLWVWICFTSPLFTVMVRSFGFSNSSTRAPSEVSEIVFSEIDHTIELVSI